MPIHDFRCPSEGCTYHLWDHYLPRVEFTLPNCPTCQVPLERLWTTSRMHRTFQPFEFDADNGEKITIDSLAKLRDVEHKSEERFRQGFGRPFNFRHYTQEPSNMDNSAYGRPETPLPDKSRMNRIKVTRGKG